MTNAKFAQLFSFPVREPAERFDQRHMNLAASIQAVTEEVMLRLACAIATGTGAKNLCLTGASGRGAKAER
jgi:carbamoyltransferase